MASAGTRDRKADLHGQLFEENSLNRKKGWSSPTD
jgi:hypothetical protein